MSEVSLYRKYRPHNFDNLVGQEHVKQTLINALRNDHIAHAYLFTGPRGTGKTSSARLIAKALNCTQLKDGFEPCNECEFCTDINSGRLIDLIEIDAASNRGIDEVRDLKEKINFAPSRSKYKVYIIDEVHMMTKEAFNALLKTLEEPPDHAYFILATTEVYKIPETIISRCQRFDFRRIGVSTVEERLKFITEKEGIKAEEKALQAIAKHVDGGMRDAIGLVEQLSGNSELSFEKVQSLLGISDHSLLGKLFEALESSDSQSALSIIQELHNHGSDLKQFVHEFIDLIREKMLVAVERGDKELTAKLIDMIEVIQSAERNVHLSIPQLALEIAVIRITGAIGKYERPAVKAVPVAAAAAQTVASPAAPASPTAQSPAPQSPAPTAPAPAAQVASVEAAAPAANKEASNVSAAPMEAKADTAAPETADTQAETASEARAHQGIGDANIDLNSVIEKWPRVTERVKTPSLRMSLKNGQPIKVEGYDITLEFKNNFHKNKVMEHDHRVELEEALKAVFGHGMKLIGIVNEVDLKPITREESVYIPDPEPTPQAAPAPSTPQQEPAAVNAALEIFGGELMD